MILEKLLQTAIIINILVALCVLYPNLLAARRIDH
jgi:hypothetical protein